MAKRQTRLATSARLDSVGVRAGAVRRLPVGRTLYVQVVRDLDLDLELELTEAALRE